MPANFLTRRNKILILDSFVGGLLCTDYADDGDGYCYVCNSHINAPAMFDKGQMVLDYRKVSIDVAGIIYVGDWPPGLSIMDGVLAVLQYFQPQKGYTYGLHE